MGRGIHRDLYKRLDEAFERGLCVSPKSKADAKRLRRAYRAGVVISPRSSIYVRPEQWSSLKRREKEEYLIRTLAARHPEWTFASVSAAIMHGLEVSYSLMDNIHLATLQPTHTRNRVGIVHHPMGIIPTTTVGGVKVTTLERTTFDCLRTTNFRSALAIADSALRVSGLDAEHFAQAFGALHHRNIGHQRAIDIMALADNRAESGGESVARAIMLEQGIMLPDLQCEIPDPISPNNKFRVDFYWELPSGNVLGELDGREKYRNPKMTGGRDVVNVLADERLRESHLSGSGNKIARFSYAQVTDVQYFRQLLGCYGVPCGYAVPPVADPRDPINRVN